jgi:hypothetical protein
MIVADGDLVAGVPNKGFKHSGTEIIIDPLGAGSIIIDPSFVERRLRTSSKTSVSNHLMSVYKKGLEGVKAATEYIRSHRDELITVQYDPEDQGELVLTTANNRPRRSSALENVRTAAVLALGLKSGLLKLQSLTQNILLPNYYFCCYCFCSVDLLF